MLIDVYDNIKKPGLLLYSRMNSTLRSAYFNAH